MRSAEAACSSTNRTSCGFPAQWPETYSYTLTAAINAGLPIVATRIGAFTERLADGH